MTDDVSMEKPMKEYLTSTSIQNISLLFSPAFEDIERFRHSLDEIVKLQMRTFILISSFLHSPFNGFGFCIFKKLVWHHVTCYFSAPKMWFGMTAKCAHRE